MLPQIAAGADLENLQPSAADHEARGHRVRPVPKVLAIEGRTVRFATPEGAEASITVECILNATGRVPVVEGLGLEEWAWILCQWHEADGARPTCPAFGPAAT